MKKQIWVYKNGVDGQLVERTVTGLEAESCESCGLIHSWDGVIHEGEYNDAGWWCRQCISRGERRTKAQYEWMFFAREYPQFALELKRLRELENSK